MDAKHEAAPLRLAVIAVAPAAAEAVVRAWCPPPHAVTVLAPGAFWLRDDTDAVLIWWDSRGSASEIEQIAHRACREGLPLIALCGGGPADHVAALRAGADAAFALPLYPEVVRAQIDAFHRGRTGASPITTPRPPASRGTSRSNGQKAVEPKSAVLEVAPLQLNLLARTLLVAGEPVHLTLREFDLLVYFAEHGGDCCSRDEILDEVWGIDFETGTNTIDVFVYALRQKLRTAGLTGVIQTVRGAGYRFVLDTQAVAQDDSQHTTPS